MTEQGIELVRYQHQKALESLAARYGYTAGDVFVQAEADGDRIVHLDMTMPQSMARELEQAGFFREVDLTVNGVHKPDLASNVVNEPAAPPENQTESEEWKAGDSWPEDKPDAAAAPSDEERKEEKPEDSGGGVPDGEELGHEAPAEGNPDGPNEGEEGREG